MLLSFISYFKAKPSSHLLSPFDLVWWMLFSFTSYFKAKPSSHSLPPFDLVWWMLLLFISNFKAKPSRHSPSPLDLVMVWWMFLSEQEQAFLSVFVVANSALIKKGGERRRRNQKWKTHHKHTQKQNTHIKASTYAFYQEYLFIPWKC